MATNIEMNVLKENGDYESLYPTVVSNNVLTSNKINEDFSLSKNSTLDTVIKQMSLNGEITQNTSELLGFSEKVNTDDAVNALFSANIGDLKVTKAENLPDTWAKCDGSEFSVDDYPELGKLIPYTPKKFTLSGFKPAKYTGYPPVQVAYNDNTWGMIVQYNNPDNNKKYLLTEWIEAENLNNSNFQINKFEIENDDYLNFFMYAQNKWIIISNNYTYYTEKLGNPWTKKLRSGITFSGNTTELATDGTIIAGTYYDGGSNNKLYYSDNVINGFTTLNLSSLTGNNNSNFYMKYINEQWVLYYGTNLFVSDEITGPYTKIELPFSFQENSLFYYDNYYYCCYKNPGTDYFTLRRASNISFDNYEDAPSNSINFIKATGIKKCGFNDGFYIVGINAYTSYYSIVLYYAKDFNQSFSSIDIAKVNSNNSTNSTISYEGLVSANKTILFSYTTGTHLVGGGASTGGSTNLVSVYGPGGLTINYLPNYTDSKGDVYIKIKGGRNT